MNPSWIHVVCLNSRDVSAVSGKRSYTHGSYRHWQVIGSIGAKKAEKSFLHLFPREGFLQKKAATTLAWSLEPCCLVFFNAAVAEVQTNYQQDRIAGGEQLCRDEYFREGEKKQLVDNYSAKWRRHHRVFNYQLSEESSPALTAAAAFNSSKKGRVVNRRWLVCHQTFSHRRHCDGSRFWKFCR